MFARIMKWVAGGYRLLLTMAVGGLVFANIVTLFAGAFTFGAEKAPDPKLLAWWVHGGWILGVCLALFGEVMNHITKSKKRETHSGTSARKRRRWNSRCGRRQSPLVSTALGGFMGAILGMLLGASFLLLWFSITYSPFAPQEWISSVSVDKRNRAAGERRESGFATDHPVALIAFGAPIALGSAAGAVFGGVCGVYQEH